MSAPELLKNLTRGARAPLLVCALAAAAQALLSIAFAWETARALDASLFAGAGLKTLAPTLILMAGLALAGAGAGFLAEQAGFEAAARIRRALFSRLLDHVARLGPTRLADLATGDLVAALTDALDALDPYFRRWTPALAAVVAAPLAILALALPMDWRSGLVLLAAAPLFFAAMILIGKGAQDASDRRFAALGRLAGHLLDAVQGLRDLVAMGAARAEIAALGESAERYRRETMAVLRIAFLSALALEFFATVSIALVAILVGFRLLEGAMDFRTGLFMLLLAPQFFAPLRAMGAERHAKMEASAAAERIAALLDRPAPAPGGAPFAPGAAVAIRFEAVSLSYGERVALENVSFEIAAGEHVALVGPSGAGKSTILALLMGFLVPTSGRIFVDGRPLDALDLESWRKAVAYAPQRAAIFSDTIAENVALGRDGDLDAALARAGASAFVAALPQGVRTPLDENGANLSGGQAQRLSLARALFSPAPLVLADEPTAHLDPRTRDGVAAALADYAQGRTSLTIAHRLGTIRAADRILVLDRGRLVEQGDHAALKAQGGLYAGLLAAGEA